MRATAPPLSPYPSRADWPFCYPGCMDGPGDRGASAAAEALRLLRESLRDCRRCGLCSGRTQVVFGVGDPDAELMFVGEGPGFHEDRLGEPFVGAAGKLLTELLGEIGLTRADVYIGNVVKCRPPENRDPTPDEIEACSPHLMDQIAIIRPKIICTLGRFATKLLADTELSMTAIHGKAKLREIAGVNLMVFPVFHPAAALYTPSNRQVLEQDFAKLRYLLAHGLNSQGEAAAGEGEAAEGGKEDLSFPRSAEELRPSSGPVKSQGVSPTRTEQLPLW